MIYKSLVLHYTSQRANLLSNYKGVVVLGGDAAGLQPKDWTEQRTAAKSKMNVMDSCFCERAGVTTRVTPAGTSRLNLLASHDKCVCV